MKNQISEAIRNIEPMFEDICRYQGGNLTIQISSFPKRIIAGTRFQNGRTCLGQGYTLEAALYALRQSCEHET